MQEFQEKQLLRELPHGRLSDVLQLPIQHLQLLPIPVENVKEVDL